MAQLVERSLPTSEVRGSNPAIGNFYIEHLFTVNCVEKTKIKKKRSGMAHFFKKILTWRLSVSHQLHDGGFSIGVSHGDADGRDLPASNRGPSHR